MPLEKYEDFLDLQIKDLTNYLSVRGLNTSGRKVEIVARAFAAFELKMNIIGSSEEQKLKLESDYHEMQEMLWDDQHTWLVGSLVIQG